MQDRIAAELSDRYRIERELGRGANAVVYLAEDLRHGRQVALKVLLVELAESVRTDRFLREIRIAAQLSHPHILPLHDSGSAGGTLYYVLPYVAGESLRARLQRERQLPLGDALRITSEVAQALAYAHSQGVVHRDIKPENILFVHGMAVVADFGIARALSQGISDTATVAGLAVGTPAYMSPEQAAGDNEVDGRSDLYALGCVLYEMLAGHPPFTGSSAHEILARHTLDPVPRLSAARPDVGEEVERTLRKALAKSPADRFSNTADFAAALTQNGSAAVRLPAPDGTSAPTGSSKPVGADWKRSRRVRAAALLVVVAGIATLIALRPSTAASARSIGVLPFVNMSADPSATEYFSDGLTDELINALTEIDSLHVASRTSSFAFKNRNLSIRAIGDSLRVASVLEGSVKRDGTRLRVTAQLVDVANGHNLWSRNFEREVLDVMDLQGEIARAIADALRIRLSGGERARLTARQTTDPEAYDLYMRGRYFLLRSTGAASIFQSIDYFNRSIERDSTYALAYSGLADGYTLAVSRGHVPDPERESTLRKAEDAARRAMVLDSGAAEAHTSLGRVLLEKAVQERKPTSPDWRAAEQHLRTATALNPRYAQAYVWLCTLYQWSGRYPEAIAAAQMAEPLDPLHPQAAVSYGVAAYYARDYDLALEKLRKGVELNPNALGDNYIGSVFLARRMPDSAIVHFRRGLEEARKARNPRGINNFRLQLATAYSYAGRRNEAMEILRDVERSDRAYITYPLLARLFVSLGQDERALEALETGYRDGYLTHYLPAYLNNRPEFDALRTHPRFKALVAALESR